MDLVVNPSGRLEGNLAAPSSKSYSIRALLCGLLVDGRVELGNVLVSRDTAAAMRVCEQLGGRLKLLDDDVIHVEGVGGEPKPRRPVVDCMNSGTTLRLATAIASISSEPVSFTGDSSLRERTLKPLEDALTSLGVRVESRNGFPPVKVKGPVSGGRVSIPGDVSSQYISALLMALPVVEGDSSIHVTGILKSRPYIDLTLNALEGFGVRIENRDYREFIVAGGQKYSARRYDVEGDYSSAAFILAAAALTDGEVGVGNLSQKSLQADKKIIEILDRMGAEVTVSEDKAVVAGDGSLQGVEVDLGDSPDLLPIVSVLGALSEGETRIVNTKHARIKECDRITAMTRELSRMGADIREKPDGLEVDGGRLKGAIVDGWRDHRIIMSLAVAGLKASGETRIRDAGHIDVTYPNFTEDIKQLGGKVKWV